MRDYLATRVAVTAFRGMKKKELTALYMSEKSKEEATPPSSPGSVDSDANSSQVETSSSDQVVEDQTNTPETEEVPKDETDDGMGCGLHLEPLDSRRSALGSYYYLISWV